MNTMEGINYINQTIPKITAQVEQMHKDIEYLVKLLNCPASETEEDLKKQREIAKRYNIDL